MATVNTTAYAIRSHAANFDRATRYPKAQSTDMARSPAPAVALALRIEWFVSAPLGGLCRVGIRGRISPPTSCRRRGRHFSGPWAGCALFSSWSLRRSMAYVVS